MKEKNRIAKFEKVSFEQFEKDMKEKYKEYPFHNYDINDIYNSIKLPKRSTVGSAGYDFFFPYPDIMVYDGGPSILIPTGIKCRIEDCWWLFLAPRSGLGTKYKLRFDNTVSVIDSDYYNNPDNEGHIFVKFSIQNGDGEDLELKQGMRFCQGMFLPYGITEDDDADGIRIGGIGSTDRGHHHGRH